MIRKLPIVKGVAQVRRSDIILSRIHHAESETFAVRRSVEGLTFFFAPNATTTRPDT